LDVLLLEHVALAGRLLSLKLLELAACLLVHPRHPRVQIESLKLAGVAARVGREKGCTGKS
jgi:hypothetical protein